jgi:CDP-paratose 2-epimerase
MRILITGIAGFVGSTLAEDLLDHAGFGQLHVIGIDNLSRAGSWFNWERLKRRGVQVIHADLRLASDLEALDPVDWVIDTAANPSVLAGVDKKVSSRQLLEHNLLSTINLLEFCKRWSAGLILLSTSRVYAIQPLRALKLVIRDGAFVPNPDQTFPSGVGPAGISESFSTASPISLYGASKLASEQVSLEYGDAFGFPVWINRCGVLAGGGQFGRPDQGIFSFWIHSHLHRAPLRYIGFGGEGYQVRDCLHPRDLVPLLRQQMAAADNGTKPRLVNVGGGAASSMSLRQLTNWCEARFGTRTVTNELEARSFDLPWIVLDTHHVYDVWGWVPQTPVHAILDEIAAHAETNPGWLQLSSST